MKKHLFSLMLIAAFGSYAAAFAQSEIVVGDMNDDGQLTVGDVTALSETVIGHKAVRRISVAGDPYAADNTIIVGQWTGISGTITFNADGTTDYKDAYTYRYLPTQCMIVFYNSDSAAVECLEVVELGTNLLVLSDASLTKFYTYGEHAFFAEDGKIYYKDDNGAVFYKLKDENGMIYFQDELGHAFVDLGLPSGTLWATCDIGASTPEVRGDRYAWGEVETKDSYEWSNYKHCNGRVFDWKKYSESDNKTELDLEDDAAYVNWGEFWRMPSYEQVTELLKKCQWTWNSIRNGFDIVGPSKNSIFIPTLEGEWTDYWTRTLEPRYNCMFAYRLCINPGDVWNTWNVVDRNRGHAIRPVRATPVSKRK